MEYKFILKNDTIGLKDTDEKPIMQVEGNIVTCGIIRHKGEHIKPYLLDYIDTDKHPLYRYYKDSHIKKAIVYLNDKDVEPVIIHQNKYYISDYSAIKVIAFPDENNVDSNNVYKIKSLYKQEESNNHDSKINPSSSLFNDVLSNVYSELASMSIEYKKNNVPESCEHYENALDELQRLRLWG